MLEIIFQTHLQAEVPLKQDLIDFKKKELVSSAITALLKKSDFLFIGEVHTVRDEAVLNILFKTFTKNGVKRLAIELPDDYQAMLDLYVASKDINVFNNDSIKRYVTKLWGPLLFNAYDLGFEIIAIDTPSDTGPDRDKGNQNPFIHREKHMARKLDLIPRDGGKTIVLIGAWHCLLYPDDYPTVRTILSKQRTTSAIQLESLSGKNELQLQRPNYSPFKAFKYFMSTSEYKRFFFPFAISTKYIEDLNIDSPDDARPSYGYSKIVDYVFFLTPDYSKPVSQ
ncbi:MAG: hypothetical protein HY559_04500 [Gammaproteobacteria bacterium]|nr:hypothetical protein [Gammaproteobacteria bacterium]